MWTYKTYPYPDTITFQPTVEKNPSLLGSGFQATHLNNRKQKTGSHQQPWKGRHWPGRQERGGVVGGPSADPLLMSVQQGLFSSALRSERPTGDPRSEGCFVSQDEAIFRYFYEMSIPTPRTGHRGSDSTLCLWFWISSPAAEYLYCSCDPKLKNAEKLEAC